METPVPSLREMEGTIILAHVPFFDKVIFQKLFLHKVEDAGIWVEHQETIDNLFAKLGYSASAKTMVLFLPWHQISFVISSIEKSSLSEKAFGL